MPNIGENVPNFKLPRDGGGEVALSDYTGQYIVLYFYPRDNTSGCTIQSKEFSDHMNKFSSLNTAVLGVSKDSVKSHEKFVEKQALTIPLLSDENSDLCEKFDVWKEKSMYGKKFMGIERSTFLIDPNGFLIKEWRKVRVKDHVEVVLQFVGDVAT
jgi:peroxiredoxin Q/BCP